MHPLQVGDIAPALVHPDMHGSVFDTRADHIAGNFLAVLFCQGDVAAAALTEFAAIHDAFRASGASIVAACTAESEAEPMQRLNLPFPLLPGLTGATLRAYGVSTLSASPGLSATVTVVLRPNGHVLEILSGDSQAATALASIRRNREANTALVSAPHAPVLIVPDVLSRKDCQDLISIYRNSDAPFVHFSEIRGAVTDVKTRIPDYDRRDRIDHRLNTPGPPRHSIVRRLQRRLLPEIKKAFQYEVTTFEGLRVACYEGERQGRAQGHRDNSQPEVAHRRFAMSLNLNSEEFSGGELRFPEYGSQLYKPQTGAAIVFSCSILHEALEVTEGRRFVLLAFFC